MKEPIWWLKNTKPLSMDRCWMPKICASAALVTGTVDNHNAPMVAANTYTLIGDKGTSRKMEITTARAR